MASDHDCERYAIGGAIAANYFNCHGIQQCMKCNRWRDIAVGPDDWQPWDSLSEHVRKRRGLHSLAGAVRDEQ